MILYVNCCVRQNSRTDELAREALSRLGNEFTEIKPADEGLHPLTRAALERRTELQEKGSFDDPMFRWARQFATADIIVIAAPFWDLSFPAELKVYLENVCVTGIVFEYDAEGRPHGLCRADKLYYVTTAGGPYVPDYSYDHIRELAKEYLGVKEVRLVMAEMLDIAGSDAAAILEQAKEDIIL